MPFNSRAFRILIASPSDVEEEREIAVKVIQEWNDLYSYTKSVVLLPLRWETHSAPEYGTRPQDVINRAIVDQCDLLVGVYWTRIGTPTGMADSGTIEEINRVAQAGKPVMLYFSKVGVDPDRIDLEQLTKLNNFKAATYPNSLVEFYKSHIEFRDKFARQLELKVRELQKADNAGGPPPLELSIASPDLKSLEGQFTTRSIDLVDVTDLNTGLAGEAGSILRLRNSIMAYIERAATVPLVLAVSNTGSLGIRNVYVEMDITASDDIDISDKEPRRPSPLFYSVNWLEASNPFESLKSGYKWTGPDVNWEDVPDLDEGLRKTDTGWRLTFEWSALQPNRRRLVVPALFVKAKRTSVLKIVAKVFADSLPEPVFLEASVEIAVREHRVLVKQLLVEVEGANSAE